MAEQLIELQIFYGDEERKITAFRIWSMRCLALVIFGYAVYAASTLAEYVNAQQPNEKEVRTAVRQMPPALQRYLFDSLIRPIIVGIANSYADKRNQRVVNESTHLAHHQGWAYALNDTDSTESPPDGGHYIVGINDLFRVPKRDCDSKEEAELQVAKRVGTEEYEVFDTEVVDVEPGKKETTAGDSK